jgi:hypothetical protein
MNYELQSTEKRNNLRPHPASHKIVIIIATCFKSLVYAVIYTITLINTASFGVETVFYAGATSFGGVFLVIVEKGT